MAKRGARPAKKAPTVTQKMSTAARTVGALSLFGIKDLWRVPTILPREYIDLRRPTADYLELKPGKLVCIGGVPERCVLLGEQAHAEEAEEAAPDEEIAEAKEGEVDEGGAEERQDSAAADDDDDPNEGEATTEVLGETAELWRIELRDRNGRRRAVVEMTAATQQKRQWIERARQGRPVWAFGSVREYDGRVLTLEQADPVAESDLGRVHALYPSKSKKEQQKSTRRKGKSRRRAPIRWRTTKLSSAGVASLVAEKNRLAIPRCADVLRERMGLKEGPDEWDLMKTLGSPGITLEATLWEAHLPTDMDGASRAAKALERLSAIEVLQQIEADRKKREDPSAALKVSRAAFERAKASLEQRAGFQLTAEQDHAAREILGDLAAPRKTHRILSGDVGTGKTAVFGVAIATICAEPILVVVLEPTKQLAAQVHANLSRWFPWIPTQLIAGETEADKTLEHGIVVGTTGLWSRLQRTGCAPAFCVADEQQRFGVAQREPEAYSTANLLECTATPIPRTQGLIEFGGIDVTALHTCHVRKEITTVAAVGDDALGQAYEDVKRRLRAEGKNLLLVYPMVHGNGPAEESMRDEAANDAYSRWDDEFPGQVSLIHGQMEESLQERALKDFESGKTTILVATRLIEVGLDLKKADMMVIHNPERLGVASVHQLRGRLARQGGNGLCYLACGKTVAEDTLALLQMMEHESDGFALALADMVRRGFGDLRRHARQQAGEYQGFLVDRSPGIDDLAWAERTCQRWIKKEAEKTNLFGGKDASDEELTKSESKTRRRRNQSGHAEESPRMEQIQLLD